MTWDGKKMSRYIILFGLVASLFIANASQAQEIVLGVGYNDFNSEISEDGYYIAADYHARRNWTLFGVEYGFGATGQVHETGEIFVGGGLQFRHALRNTWFVEASVMPGYYFNNSQRNDLGSDFEIRSLLGIGREFGNGSHVSFALTHISNASIGEDNPGMNAVSLRFHFPLSARHQ
ncbi:acyloxyacyl hydrolase [Tritonibacter mobilis]|uniref:acyloxyacyl hydrolase n=2 Tax=Tritonibacter mobilis TaxID=379347 RepID=UPI000A8FC540|nr:acyloxyacyl hydrolase [Tritonibacter mobilis]